MLSAFGTDWDYARITGIPSCFPSDLYAIYHFVHASRLRACILFDGIDVLLVAGAELLAKHIC